MVVLVVMMKEGAVFFWKRNGVVVDVVEKKAIGAVSKQGVLAVVDKLERIAQGVGRCRSGFFNMAIGCVENARSAVGTNNHTPIKGFEQKIALLGCFVVTGPLTINAV
jgi:hypothetical protein